MKKLQRTLLASLVLGLGMAGVAAQAQTVVNEAEPNNPISLAQSVQFDSTGTITVSGAIGDTTDLADYYVFYANAGEVLNIDIDNGWGGGAVDVDTSLAVYNVSLGYHIERENTDSLVGVDPGSSTTLDPFIDNFSVPTSGYYVVAVTQDGVMSMEGGGTSGSPYGSGDYTLIITGGTPAAAPASSSTPPPADTTTVDTPPPPAEPGSTEITTVDGLQQINIEIKPGNRQRARYNPWSRGTIPVALLSSPTFDPSKVVQSSLRFGATGDEASLAKCEKRGRDVNRDGHPDLICHFDSKKADFQKGDVEGIVSGTTTDGIGFEGHGVLKVVHEKRDHDREPRRRRHGRH